MTVTEIPWLWLYIQHNLRNTALPVIGRELVKISRELGHVVANVDFDVVHTYHHEAVAEFQRRLDNDPNYLAIYRWARFDF